MEPSVEYAKAWQALEPHWSIKPASGGIPSTPLYSGLRRFLSPMLRPLLRWRISGAGRVPREGPVILAANHLSHVDPIAVIAAARRTTYYLAKEGHFEKWYTRVVMNATGQIETKRAEGGTDALASAATVLEQGQALGIFPEGTRSRRTEAPFLLPGKTGVARLAAAYPHAKVVPIALNGTRNIMAPKADKVPRLWKRFEVNIGQPVSWLEWLQHPNGGDMSAQQLMELGAQSEHEVRATLAQLYRMFTDQMMGSLQALGAP